MRILPLAPALAIFLLSDIVFMGSVLRIVKRAVPVCCAGCGNLKVLPRRSVLAPGVTNDTTLRHTV
jgi:hypothetical protein